MESMKVSLKVLAVGHARRTDEPYLLVEFTQDQGNYRWGQILAALDCPDKKVKILRSAGGNHDLCTDKYRARIFIDPVSFPLEQLSGKMLVGEATSQEEPRDTRTQPEIIEVLQRGKQTLAE